MEFNAKSVTYDGENLIISFELLSFKAVVKVLNHPTYMEFKLVDFITNSKDNVDLYMDYPPVEEFRILQLPIKNLKNLGEWLNVMHDEEIAVNVLGTSAHPWINSSKRDGYRILLADARKGIKLKDCSAILIATEKQELLNVIDTVENDYNLPRGVRSRKSKDINRSIIVVL